MSKITFHELSFKMTEYSNLLSEIKKFNHVMEKWSEGRVTGVTIKIDGSNYIRTSFDKENYETMLINIVKVNMEEELTSLLSELRNLEVELSIKPYVFKETELDE